MKISRRQVLRLATGAAALSISGKTRAQSYPLRPVHLIVGFAAGSSPDILARIMGQWLSERLGHPFVVDNRPGAGGTIGAEAVARAEPDGHTLLLLSASNAINATLYERLDYSFSRDIMPVGAICGGPNVMVINPSLPVKTLAEFVAYAQANPGKLNMASAGTGTGPHLAGELFKMMAKVDLTHVPYRGGGPAITDLIGGQVQVMFPTTSSSIEYVRSGKVRALGVTTVSRLDVLPDVPTIGDVVPGYEASAWFGVGAPRKTPTGIVEELNEHINSALSDPKLNVRLVELGNIALPGSVTDFGKFVADEIEKWAKVVRFAGLKPE